MSYQPTQHNPFFDVIRKPAYTKIEGEEVELPRDVLLNEENNKLLGVVSKNYKVIHNSEVAQIFNDALEGVNIKSITDHLNPNTDRWLREIIVDDENFVFQVEDQDYVNVKINIYNGFTAQNAVGFYIDAYRQICSNGMMGWGKIFGESFNHISEDMIDKIRNAFFKHVASFHDVISEWEDWTEIPFNEEDFRFFINTRDYLKDNMKDYINNSYNPILSTFGDEKTKWGSYNVLTALGTHFTKANKGGSYLFSNGFKRYERLAKEFINANPRTEQWQSLKEQWKDGQEVTLELPRGRK